MNSILKFLGITILVISVSWFLSEKVIYEEVELTEYNWEEKFSVDLNNDGSEEQIIFEGKEVLNDRIDLFNIIINDVKYKDYSPKKYTDISKHHIYIGDIENDGIKEIFLEGVDTTSEKYPIYYLDVYRYKNGMYIYSKTIEKGEIKYNTILNDIKVNYQVENQETKEIIKRQSKYNKI